MVYTLSFFFSLKCSLFHNSNLFGSCIIHILYTECAKIKKNNSGAKRLKEISQTVSWKSNITDNLPIGFWREVIHVHKYCLCNFETEALLHGATWCLVFRFHIKSHANSEFHWTYKISWSRWQFPAHDALVDASSETVNFMCLEGCSWGGRGDAAQVAEHEANVTVYTFCTPLPHLWYLFPHYNFKFTPLYWLQNAVSLIKVALLRIVFAF